MAWNYFSKFHSEVRKWKEWVEIEWAEGVNSFSMKDR